MLPEIPAERLSVDFPRNRLLHSLLRIAESSLTVGDLATSNLWFVEPDWTVERAFEEMTAVDFDCAPLRDSRPYRYVMRSELQQSSGSAQDASRIIDAAHLVTFELGLAHGISLLRERGFFFVLRGDSLSGIVTLADLQLPPVSMVTFALILAIEAGIDRLIVGVMPETWQEFLSVEEREEVEAIFAERVRHNVEITLLDCLFLPSRLKLLLKHRTLRTEFCPGTRNEYDLWTSRLINTRNVLAHGGTLLNAEPDPVKAIEWFGAIRGFAERLWAFPESPSGSGSAPGPVGDDAGSSVVTTVRSRKEVIADHVAALIDDFPGYVQAYDRLVPFSSDQLRAHRRTIALRLEAGSAAAAIASDVFIASLRSTLAAWRLGLRGSRLAELPEFISAIRVEREAIEALEGLNIEAADLPDDVPERIWAVVSSLEIVANKAKIVAGTKALHHLLPDLVVPIDRAWTGKFFQLQAYEWQNPSSQHRAFLRAFRCFVEVARRANPERYVDGSGWRTSRTKIIDNALIGYCKLELGRRRAAQ